MNEKSPVTNTQTVLGAVIIMAPVIFFQLTGQMFFIWLSAAYMIFILFATLVAITMFLAVNNYKDSIEVLELNAAVFVLNRLCAVFAVSYIGIYLSPLLAGAMSVQIILSFILRYTLEYSNAK